jgi:hypothetical protein
LLVYGVKHYRVGGAVLVKQFLDVLVTFAAIAAHAKAFKQLAAGTNAIVDGCFDVPVSDGFTNTYIHEHISGNEAAFCK